MRSTTSATEPVSYYEVLSAFRAAACAARGTDLRGQSLVDLDVFGSMLNSFVVELRSKLRPAGIEYGLRQAGFGKLTSTGGRILDPVPVRQHHGNMVVDTRCENKTDAKHPAGIFTLDLPSGCDAETHGNTNSIVIDSAPPPHRKRRGFRRGELR
ncbi:MAG TPA: hypothetical protein VHY36_10155 [Steroidobacteraceae bacterium]|nr:hypothetical protein [Steroidobacteraceae bacterium]